MYKGVEVQLQALWTSVMDEGALSSLSGPSTPEGKDSSIQWTEHCVEVDPVWVQYPVDWTLSGSRPSMETIAKRISVLFEVLTALGL
jgi:hypothetical protein